MPSPLGFSRDHRLIGKHAFQNVFAKSKKIIFKSLLAFYLENDYPQTPVKLGIIIKKSAIKHAVTRNRIRRIIRESFRRAKSTTALQGLDIVILVRSECSSNQNLIRANIGQLWKLIADARQSASKTS